MILAATTRAQESLTLLEALQSAYYSHQGDYTLQRILADTIADLQALSVNSSAADRPELSAHLSLLEQLYHSLMSLSISLETAATRRRVCHAVRRAAEAILIVYSPRS